MDSKNIAPDKKKELSLTHRMSTTQYILFGFLMIILTGAFILMLPISSAAHEFTSFVDALFTATTSVCVTGLTTTVTATHWSLFGKVIILILIQLGGLGVICVGIGIMIFIKKKIGLKERLLIQESYNMNQMGGMVRLIKNVIISAFMMEAFGAVLFSIVFIPEFGVLKGIWYSVFHSVSAFCNAGIDIIGPVSFMGYKTNYIVNLTTMLLIITGGIGFVVWWDLKKVIINAFKIRKFKGQILKKLEVHSKLAIFMTVLLIFIGAILFLAFEYNNKGTIGNYPLHEKILISFFQSVTTRTAGFATVDQALMRDSSFIIVVLLMFIGGSPMGTAGGLKTTNVGMLMLSVKSTIKGKKDTEVFGRRISKESIRTGHAVIILAVLFALSAIMLLSITEDKGLKDITFEVISAIGTVGLTRGITMDLTDVGKIIISFVMFIGRLGPITLAMAFSKKSEKYINMRELAETKIIVG